MEKKQTLTTEDIYCYQTLSTSNPNKTKSRSKNRKNNNRRKKQRKRELQLKVHLTQWIVGIYRLETNYEKIKPEVVQYLTPQIESNTFYYFLHKIIQDEIQSIATEIGEKTKEIWAINPILTAQLYQKIQIILQASPEIQHIINYFTFIKEKTQAHIQQFFDKSTLKYIFDGDSFLPYKEQFIQICQRFLEVKDFKDERQRVLFRKILENIHAAEEFEKDQSEDDYEDEDEQYLYEEYMMRENQEGLDMSYPKKYQQELEQQKKYKLQGKQNMRARQKQGMEEESKKNKKKKNKKKKTKKTIVSENYIDEVIDCLTNTIFEKNRAVCYIPEDDQENWVNRLREKLEGLDDP